MRDARFVVQARQYKASTRQGQGMTGQAVGRASIMRFIENDRRLAEIVSPAAREHWRGSPWPPEPRDTTMTRRKRQSQKMRDNSHLSERCHRHAVLALRYSAVTMPPSNRRRMRI